MFEGKHQSIKKKQTNKEREQFCYIGFKESLSVSKQDTNMTKLLTDVNGIELFNGFCP